MPTCGGRRTPRRSCALRALDHDFRPGTAIGNDGLTRCSAGRARGNSIDVPIEKGTRFSTPCPIDILSWRISKRQGASADRISGNSRDVQRGPPQTGPGAVRAPAADSRVAASRETLRNETVTLERFVDRIV